MGEAREPQRQRVGDSEIVREIGRGGIGIVYEARQISLNRRVALKVLGGGRAQSSARGRAERGRDRRQPRFRRLCDRSGAVRVIVPISDEGPCLGTSTNGCNDPGSDREATTNAIAVAVANDVIVSPITASGSTTCVITLAGALAAGTGGTAVQSTNPSSDLADAIATIVLAVCASVTECDDADPCTNDLCGANGACAHTPRCEACCLPDRTCRDDRTQAGCESMEGEFRGVGIPCWGDDDGDGMDDMCEAGRVAIPTVSEWGLTILAPLLLTTGKVYLGRRKLAAT